MLLRKKQLFTTPHWKTRHELNVEFRFFFPPIFKPLWTVLWRKRIQGRNISQYRSHTKEFLNRPNLNKICDRLANGLFFPCIIYKSKVSSLKNVSAVGHVLPILFYYLAFWEAIYVYGLPRGWFRPIVLHELLFYKNTI